MCCGNFSYQAGTVLPSSFPCLPRTWKWGTVCRYLRFRTTQLVSSSNISTHLLLCGFKWRYSLISVLINAITLSISVRTRCRQFDGRSKPRYYFDTKSAFNESVAVDKISPEVAVGVEYSSLSRDFPFRRIAYSSYIIRFRRLTDVRRLNSDSGQSKMIRKTEIGDASVRSWM